jgi:predicted amino acid racemase
MRFPRLEIDLTRLEQNARFEVELLARRGITVMGVNKVFNGLRATAEAIVRGGIRTVAESRISNLRGLEGLDCEKCLLRSPGPSEIADTVRFADVSLVADAATSRALSAEAVKQGRRHSVLFMVDMGDLREGIWFEDRAGLRDALRVVLALPGLDLYGLGTNFNCFGAIKPTPENGAEFVALARGLETELGTRFRYLSGGNCTSFSLFDRWPEGINHLRIGGLHQFGIEYVSVAYVEGFHHSSMDVRRVCSPLYRLRAEVIEANVKPTVPRGEAGVDAFLQPKRFADRGPRRRAILAVGRQDLPASGMWACDGAITILGQTSDHTLLDVHDCVREYGVGDVVDFELDYTALLHACSSPGVEKIAT